MKIIDRQEQQFYQVIDKYKSQKGALIPLLQEAQGIFGYLSKNVLEKIAFSLDISFSEVYGVATFYSQFRLKPVGKHIIKICSGTACHVKGGPSIAKELESLLHIKEGETTKDLRFTLETVACLGACGLAPVMMINEQTYGRMTKNKINKLLKQFD